MIALARALRDSEGIGSVFAVNGREEALQPIIKAGFEAKLLDSPSADLSNVAQHPDLLILDCREGATCEEVEKLDIGLKVVVDDGSDRRLAADIAYYPPVPQTATLNWAGSHCQARIGWEWALLGPMPTPTRPPVHSPCPTLLVTMGGSDPLNLTERCAHALKRLDPVFRARFVIGPGFRDAERMARSIVRLSPNFETVEGADTLVTEFATCDVALVAFGVTAYELGAYGVPAIYLGISDDHSQSASAFEHAGMGISLGTASRCSDKVIAETVWSLLNDNARCKDMHAAGLMTIDGLAANRIATDLALALAKRRVLKREVS
jgi:spore coat polysaccharide biosynthesis protein SpsF